MNLAACLRSDPTDTNPLAVEVRDLLDATGLVPATAFVKDSSHQALAKRFRTLAGASDPLAAEFRDPALWGPLRALARTRGRLARWQASEAGLGSRRGPRWADLTRTEQGEARALARHLARCHAAWVRRGRAKQEPLDTALSGLAEIYARHAGVHKHAHDLPHAEGSAFIAFCAAALALTGVSVSSRTPKALARRWRRLKDLHRDGLPAPSLKRRRRAVPSAPLRRR